MSKWPPGFLFIRHKVKLLDQLRSELTPKMECTEHENKGNIVRTLGYIHIVYSELVCAVIKVKGNIFMHSFIYSFIFYYDHWCDWNAIKSYSRHYQLGV